MPTPTIGQMLSASYNLVIAEKKKPANQWAESALMRELERQGAIKHESLGPMIEAPLDYQRNQGGAFLATELQPTAMTATEVIQAASFTPAELSVPIVWSKRTEALNPSVNQKVPIVRSLLDNADQTHDDLIEQALFATSTNGFLGLITHCPTTGQSSDGGIDSSMNAFWRSQNSTYVDDTDIEAAFTTVYNACTKGSGSNTMPTLMASDGPTQALFEGTQQAQQRWVDSQDLKAGFKTLGFKTCRYVFSPYGTTTVYFLTPKVFNLVVSKEFFKQMDPDAPIQNAQGYVKKMYSALQTVVTNRSRIGCAHT